MGFNMWFIFVSFLLVSVGASRYDQGPQKFYDFNSDSATAEQNENNEVVLYLTTEQIKALEADGAVLQSAEDPENDEADDRLPAVSQVNEDRKDNSEQDENEDVQEEAQQEEQENSEDIQNQNIDFEEILRILNEEQVEEEVEEDAEEQARNDPQVDDENIESNRNFSPRITVRQQLQQQQQDERSLAPTVAKNEQTLKSYSLIRYQPNEQRQRFNVQRVQQQEEANDAEESSQEPQSKNPTQEKKKYKLVPYEVLETTALENNAEEQAQNAEAKGNTQRLEDLIIPLVNTDRLSGANGQRRNRLESILRELKASPKYNEQKYAFEIERLRADLDKQNAALKVETNAKVITALIKQQLNKKRRLNKSKQGKGRDAESQKTQQPKFQRSSATWANAKPIAVPVITAEKPEEQRSVPVPVETSKRIRVKNVYVTARTDKPYIISRRVPENKRQN